MEFLIYFVKTLGLLFVAILLLYLIIAIIKTPIDEEKKRKVTNEKLNELLQQINDDLDKAIAKEEEKSKKNKDIKK